MHIEILLEPHPVVESGTFSTEGLTNRAIDIFEALSLPGHCNYALHCAIHGHSAAGRWAVMIKAPLLHYSGVRRLCHACLIPSKSSS